MKEYLESQEDGSYKFWQIEVIGKTYVVTYGRIGTSGQQTVKEFGSEEEALKEAETIMKAKMKKGYQKKDAKSEALVSKRFELNEDQDDELMKKQMEDFFKSKKAAETNEIVLGEWLDAYDSSPDEYIDLIVQNKDKLPNLKHLYIGDMDSDVCEISWINLCDLTPLVNAFPGLESLKIQGSQGLELKPFKHAKLKRLEIVCGGLGADVIDAIADSEMPALEHLELYLGTEDYGFDGSIDNVKPFFDKGRFPSLKYLGLEDSEIADEIAEEIVKSDIFDQIEVLDLSQGTLSDKGGEFLVNSEGVKKLKKLDLHYHFMSDEMIQKFKKLGITVDVSDPQDDEDGEYRFVAIGE